MNLAKTRLPLCYSARCLSKESVPEVRYSRVGTPNPPHACAAACTPSGHAPRPRGGWGAISRSWVARARGRGGAGSRRKQAPCVRFRRGGTLADPAALAPGSSSSAAAAALSPPRDHERERVRDHAALAAVDGRRPAAGCAARLDVGERPLRPGLVLHVLPPIARSVRVRRSLSRVRPSRVRN